MPFFVRFPKFDAGQIVSSSDAVRKFGELRKKAKVEPQKSGDPCEGLRCIC